MKVAIAGAGIAGGYLARLLSARGIVPDLYDGKDHGTGCGSRSCGWGAPVGIGKYLDLIDLDLQHYFIEPMFTMNFDGLVAKTPLCTINKPLLLQDLISGIRLQERRLDPDTAQDYDILVDATGINRSLLPPCQSDLTLPTLQHRVRAVPRTHEQLEAGVYGNQIPGLGYLWVFPLAKDLHHIGVGGIGLVQHDAIMEQFYHDASDRFTFTPICSCAGKVRVASPFYSTPFSITMARKNGMTQQVVGVGESIGTVSPFTGEGIIYSLECARLLADFWPDFDTYSRKVLKTFTWMKKERETLDFLLTQAGNGGPRLRDRWRFYRNAQRSGIKLPMLEAFKRMGSLSRWMEGQDKGR
jgi:flavin-dependent dehydrogenase